MGTIISYPVIIRLIIRISRTISLILSKMNLSIEDDPIKSIPLTVNLMLEIFTHFTMQFTIVIKGDARCEYAIVFCMNLARC